MVSPGGISVLCLFHVPDCLERSEVNEGVVYNLLMFPCVLLVFYPAVFGIQNDEDSRILEILSASPTINIRYGVSVY